MSIPTILVLALLAAAFVLGAGCTQTAPSGSAAPAAAATTPAMAVAPTPPSAPSAPSAPALPAGAASADGQKVRLETTMGNITIALDPAMPVTAGNFAGLVQKGFYNGVIFHRVINGFMIQGGDPTGTGRGGPGYTIQDEYTGHNRNSRGAIAMANTGAPNSGGSQFFINLVDNSGLQGGTFDQHYPVFGNVVDGMDVVDAIGAVPTSGSPYDRPLQNVTILRAEMV